MDDLQLYQASLDSKDEQGDALCHSSVHGVVIHKSSVALQVELAQSENSQCDEGDSENQTQERVWCTTTFCNTGKKEEKESLP